MKLLNRRPLSTEVRSLLSALSVQLLTGCKQELSQQAHIVEQIDPEPNVSQLSELEADHQIWLLSDEDSAGETREVDGDGTVQRAYIVMLETEVDRLQTQLDQMVSNDVPPSYYASSDDGRIRNTCI